MKKLWLFCAILCIFLLSAKVEASAVSSDYGEIKIVDINIGDEEIYFTTNVNAKDELSRYFVCIEAYEYKNGKLEWVYETGYRYDEVFGYGENLRVTISDLLYNVYRVFDDGTYCFRAILHDATGYEESDGEYYTACFAISNYMCKRIKVVDENIEMLNYDCNVDGHIYSEEKICKEPTIEENGIVLKSCFACGHEVEDYLQREKPIIELSTDKKTIRKKYSFDLELTKIANGDEITEIIVKDSKVVKVKKKQNVIRITGKKVGNTTVIVKLKSGIEAKCDIKVINDKFFYSIEKLEYSTRNNTIIADITNHSKHTVTIYATGAKCIDWDYKEFDRNVESVNGKSTVKIKPGKTVKVKFKLSSNATWPGYKRKTIKFKTKLDGQVKWIKVSENDLY